MSKKSREEALADWHRTADGRPRMREGSSRADVEDEAEWLESNLMRILDKHATQITVTDRCKR